MSLHCLRGPTLAEACHAHKSQPESPKRADLRPKFRQLHPPRIPECFEGSCFHKPALRGEQLTAMVSRTS